MPQPFICTYLNSLPIAYPPSSVLRKYLFCILFNICVSVIYAAQLECLGIILFMLAMLPFLLLYLTLGYIAWFSIFCFFCKLLEKNSE